MSSTTRIEVVTEGVLLRRLQRDPALTGTGLLFFDEFHERNLEADLALAFAIETRKAFRGDLRLLVASTTLDGDRVAPLLGDAPVIRAEGRRHPVEVVHRQRAGSGRLTDAVREGRLRARRPLGDWPALDDASLLADAERVLGPFLLGVRRRNDLADVRVGDVLRAQLTPAQLRDLDRLAPNHLEVPSGSRVALDYTAGERPVLAVKLQEMFGRDRTPAVVDGRVAVLLQLTSPAGRPVQVTDDLASFWVRGYPQVRAELRGRYPKHPWPEDPTTATPTRRTTRRR